jgi:uncharacterized membrane protein YfcA
MPSKPDKSLFLLGKYLSLAVTLPAAVFAGYLLGTWFSEWLLADFLKIIGILLGLGAGLVQIFRELNRETKPKP